MDQPINSIKVALVGNPNAGKTSLFNSLAGTKYSVANYPGITVDRKYATINHKLKSITINDLPGLYSINSYSPEESITAEHLLNSKVDIVLQVLDQTNLARNLNLTIQILELGLPLIIVANMEDEAQKRKISLDYELLSKKLNCPVVSTIAIRNKGLEELLDQVTSYNLENNAYAWWISAMDKK